MNEFFFNKRKAVFLSSNLKCWFSTNSFKCLRFNINLLSPLGFSRKKYGDKNWSPQGSHFWIAPLFKSSVIDFSQWIKSVFEKCCSFGMNFWFTVLLNGIL